ncbi:MAG: family 1 encapsulin nanocompartment shell protein [Gammaproteobacteria bacterium]
MDYLNRHLAPFSEETWNRIEAAAVTAAREDLTARRFLDVDGPYGVGLTALELGSEDYCRQPRPEEAGAVISSTRALPVPMIRKSFQLSMRRVVAAEEQGAPLDLTPAEEAGEAIARREEEFIYDGSKETGLEGLLGISGGAKVRIGDWKNAGQVLEDMLKAVAALEKNGFLGPYALALPPKHYTLLFRRYEGSDVLQLEHLKRLCEKGVYKAEIAKPVLVDPNVGHIVIGQDLRCGFSGTDGIHYQLFANESVVLKVEEPGAVCVLGS